MSKPKNTPAAGSGAPPLPDCTVGLTIPVRIDMLLLQELGLTVKDAANSFMWDLDENREQLEVWFEPDKARLTGLFLGVGPTFAITLPDGTVILSGEEDEA